MGPGSRESKRFTRGRGRETRNCCRCSATMPTCRRRGRNGWGTGRCASWWSCGRRARRGVGVNGHAGQKMMARAGYLEMARVAVEKAARGSQEMLLELRNVVWAQPLVVPPNQRITIALMAKDSEEIDFEIYSQNENEEII